MRNRPSLERMWRFRKRAEEIIRFKSLCERYPQEDIEKRIKGEAKSEKADGIPKKR